MIRTFMRVTFPKLIDVLFALSLIGTVLGALGMAWAMSVYGIIYGFLMFVVTILSGAVGTVLVFGGIYVLFDIRDTLFEMKE